MDFIHYYLQINKTLQPVDLSFNDVALFNATEHRKNGLLTWLQTINFLCTPVHLTPFQKGNDNVEKISMTMLEVSEFQIRVSGRSAVA